MNCIICNIILYTISHVSIYHLLINISLQHASGSYLKYIGEIYLIWMKIIRQQQPHHSELAHIKIASNNQSRTLILRSASTLPHADHLSANSTPDTSRERQTKWFPHSTSAIRDRRTSTPSSTASIDTTPRPRPCSRTTLCSNARIGHLTAMPIWLY